MAAPSEYPEWASGAGAAITDPTLAEKQAGWSAGEEPPAEYFNWWMNNVYLWILWLAGSAIKSVANTFTALQTFANGISVSGSATFANGIGVTGAATFSAGLAAGSAKITSVADPTVATDAATKNYVDANAYALPGDQTGGTCTAASVGGTPVCTVYTGTDIRRNAVGMVSVNISLNVTAKNGNQLATINEAWARPMNVGSVGGVLLQCWRSHTAGASDMQPLLLTSSGGLLDQGGSIANGDNVYITGVFRGA